MDKLLIGTNLSTTNYDLILKSWAAQAVQNGVHFAASAGYSKNSEAARQHLINKHSWIINDGGPVQE